MNTKNRFAPAGVVTYTDLLERISSIAIKNEILGTLSTDDNQNSGFVAQSFGAFKTDGAAIPIPV